MEAIEFEATLGSDGIISIPNDIGKKVRRGKVRVIIIEREPAISDRGNQTTDKEQERARNYIDFLMANPIKVDKSKPFLTRDELYDRSL